jgi:DNA-binding NtrC family response regulator
MKGKASARRLAVQIVTGPRAGRLESGGTRLTIGSSRTDDVVLDDASVSASHVELSVDAHGIRVRDAASESGTFVGDIRVRDAIVGSGALLSIGSVLVRVFDARVGAPSVGETELDRMCARSPAMAALHEKIVRAARSDVPILLVGESGTGKERLARGVHACGARAEKPFRTVDCASLSPSLVASELFGHERGAFTGAERTHVGAFEEAADGTIFLDEIGELPEALQRSLLGVLERRRFRRVGGSQQIESRARVVCATNRDLRVEVDAGRFRLDLYYRIAVVRIDVPPLRERVEDVEGLVEDFLRADGDHRTIDDVFSPNERAWMRSYEWPGNIRELKNLVAATVAMGEMLNVEPQRRASDTSAPEALLDQNYGAARAAAIDAFESRYLPRLLRRAGGNVSRAAREADMDRSHLWEMLRRRGLR